MVRRHHFATSQNGTSEPLAPAKLTTVFQQELNLLLLLVGNVQQDYHGGRIFDHLNDSLHQHALLIDVIIQTDCPPYLAHEPL